MKIQQIFSVIYLPVRVNVCLGNGGFHSNKNSTPTVPNPTVSSCEAKKAIDPNEARKNK